MSSLPSTAAQEPTFRLAGFVPARRANRNPPSWRPRLRITIRPTDLSSPRPATADHDPSLRAPSP